VAHGADIAMQLVLNPAVDRAGVDRLLDAIASQVAPPAPHYYVAGEPERLARPVLFAAQRGLYTADEWEKWLQKIAAPPPSVDPTAAFRTQAGLARRHNLHAFMNALYVNAREGGDKNVEVLVAPLQTVIKTLR
jgi:hypothetical protein